MNTRVHNVQFGPAAYNGTLIAKEGRGQCILNSEGNQSLREVNGFETSTNSRRPLLDFTTTRASTPVNAAAHHTAPPSNGNGIGIPVSCQNSYFPGLSPQATCTHAIYPPVPYPSKNPLWMAQLMNKVDAMDNKLVNINGRVDHLESEIRALHTLQSRVCEMGRGG
ncbi:hypothetical protein ElyMa_005102000 [Elysia marginata]|uniref:Uncharacterized protein n=1 Tax=Elysia marginata TaxID=1093978 RepID=A0AAV4JLC3_9GAST|nr:hypothetical protein ElyMa_005102000 [Elysia marginata]